MYFQKVPCAPPTIACLDLRKALWKVVPVDRMPAGIGDLKVTRDWKGELCRTRLANSGKNAIRVKKSFYSLFPMACRRIHISMGESFQMLSPPPVFGQAAGLGYSERNHYNSLSLRTRLSFPE